MDSEIKFTTTAHGSGIAVSWQTAIARFHIWLTEDGVLLGDTIYKNPLAERGQPGYFDTRRLKSTSASNAKIVALALKSSDVAGALKAKADAAAGEAALRKQEAADRARTELLNSKAPAMLEMLKKLSNGMTVSGRRHYGLDKLLAELGVIV
jgi:hypothetical protein